MMATLPILGGGTKSTRHGETVQYMMPHQDRFLGKNAMTSESIIGIQGRIISATTSGRQIEPDKHDRQLMDIINAPP